MEETTKNSDEGGGGWGVGGVFREPSLIVFINSSVANSFILLLARLSKFY